LTPVLWGQLGGDPQRTRYTSQTPALPLELSWMERASSAVGRNLIAVDNHIFYSTLDGRIECRELTRGKRTGRIKIQGNVPTTCAYSDGSLVLVGRKGRISLARYDLISGKFLWKTVGVNSFSEPLITGDRVYVGTVNSKLAGFDLDSGSELWRVDLNGQSHAAPSCARDRIVIGDDSGNISAFYRSSERAWTYSAGSGIRAPAAISGNSVYLGSLDGTFYALDLLNGAERWRFQAGGKIYRSAAVDSSRVVFGTTERTVYALDRKDGAYLWSFKAESVIGTAPLIAGDIVLFGSLDKKLYALDAASGEKLWSFEARGRIRTNPVYIQGRVVFASENDRLYCLEKK